MCIAGDGDATAFHTYLSPAQQAAEDGILDFVEQQLLLQTEDASRPHGVVVVEGAPGTGKSALLAHLFGVLQHRALHSETKKKKKDQKEDALSGRDNVLIVNHAEMLKRYQTVTAGNGDIPKHRLLRPTPFVNGCGRTQRTADVALVDEAHLLLSQTDAYNRFRQDNQLREIVRCARVVVAVFDEGQVLKTKSAWSASTLEDILEGHPTLRLQLDEQFRVRASQLHDWVEKLVRHKRLDALPDEAYDLRFFEHAQDLRTTLHMRNGEGGGCRMLSTYDYAYALDGKDHYIEEPGGFRMRWDRFVPSAALAWPDRPESTHEVGSVYTIQGFDLRWAGVILGPSIDYDPDEDRIVVRPECSHDSAAFVRRRDGSDDAALRERIVLNAVYVLLTRGVQGLYVYASRPALRARLLELQGGDAKVEGRGTLDEKPKPKAKTKKEKNSQTNEDETDDDGPTTTRRRTRSSTVTESISKRPRTRSQKKE